MLNASQTAAGLPPLWRGAVAPCTTDAVPETTAAWCQAAQRSGFPQALIDAACLARPAAPVWRTQGEDVLLVFALPAADGPLFVIEAVCVLANAQQVLIGRCSAQAGITLLNRSPTSAQGVDAQLAALLRDGAHRFIEALRSVNAGVDAIEAQLQQAIVNRHIFELLAHNKCLNLLLGALTANLRLLQRRSDRRGGPAQRLARRTLEEAMVQTAQAHAMARIHHLNLSNLMDAYSAAVENNLSLVVQYLSIFVIVAAVPMGVASLYGMNIPLPFQDAPYALPALAALSVLLSALMVGLFKARRLL